MKLPFAIIAAFMALNFYSAAGQNKNVKKTSPAESAMAFQKENALGTGIFDALKKGNADHWIALYPTNDEFKSMLESMLAGKMEGLTRQKVDEMLAARQQDATTFYATEFDHFITLSDSLGISWKDAVFQKFDHTAEYADKVKRLYLNGDIWFTCQQHHFVITGIEAIEFSAGYKLQSVKNIRRINGE